VEKKKNITYSECAFVALGIQYAVRMLHVFIYGLPDSAIFFHFISYRQDFKKIKKGYKIQNLCSDFSLQLFVRNIPRSQKNLTRYGQKQGRI